MGKTNPGQQEFRRMVRDLPRNMLPKGACWTIRDGLPGLGAGLRNRGGWAHYSDDVTATIAAASQVVATAYGDAMTTPRLVGVSEDGRLFYVATDGTGNVTDVGTLGGLNPTGFAQLGGQLVIPDLGGGAVPKKYNGTTLADLGGSPPLARYVGSWKALLLLANVSAQPQRLYFSTADNNPESWDPTNTFWDFSYPIVGLGPLRNAVLVFHGDYTSRLRGSTPPPGGDLIADDPLFSVGCIDNRSIATWGEQIIWADDSGIYISDGIVPNDLTAACGMSSYYRDVMVNWQASGATWSACGGVIQNHYVISVVDRTNGVSKLAAMIDLRKNAWVNLGNFDALGMWRTTALGGEKLFFGRRGGAFIGEFSSVFTPSSTYKNDGDGDAVAYEVETPFYEFGQGLDVLRDAYVTFDMRDAASDNPTLAVGYVTDPASTSYTTAVTLTETSARDRKRATVNRSALGFGFKIAQANASSDSRLYGIDFEGYALEDNRLV